VTRLRSADEHAVEDGRLVIRTFEAADADSWVAMFNDPVVTHFLPGVVGTLETFHAALESRRAMEAELGYAMWAVEENSTG
jgi:RimJ/RimL family protein N-acetyltransferase